MAATNTPRPLTFPHPPAISLIPTPSLPQSSADAGFWHALSSRKLEEFKLDDSHRAITGYYAAGLWGVEPA